MSTTTTDTPKPQFKYRILGRSGLRVHPVCLGAMHFGTTERFTKMGVSATEEDSERIILKYIENGGNFIDTANIYHYGQSEEIIGRVIKKHNIPREKLVIATKYTGPMSTDPNQAGNHKKNFVAALDDSLKRLQLDYVDLYYVHFYDFSMDMRDLIRDLQVLVNSGKVLHLAISDAPAWQVAVANTYADEKGWSPFVAFQARYSLIDRSLEQDILPMSRKLNIGVVPWGVLGQGKLTGSRKREGVAADAKRAVSMTEEDYVIQDEVIKIAEEQQVTPSQIALAWMIQVQGITSAIVGPKNAEQIEDLMKVMNVTLTEDQVKRLNNISKDCPQLIFPHNFLGNSTQSLQWLYLLGRTYEIEN